MTTDYVALLREAVRTSGLSAEQYFKKILMRNPRTGRRWMRGDAPIPEAVRDYLEANTIRIKYDGTPTEEILP